MRRYAAIAIAALGLALSAQPATGAVTNFTFELVSPDDSGGVDVFSNDLAEDGSRVTLATEAALSPDDQDGGEFDVYLRTGGTTQFASGGSNGADPVFIRGATPNLDHIFMETDLPLLPADNDGGRQDVYEYAAGQLSLVSTGGDGAFDAGFGRVSDDGLHVFFTTGEPLLPAQDQDADKEDVYERFGGQQTRLISEGTNPVSAADVFLRDISADGTRVFLETAEPLDGSGDTDPNFDVYERFGAQTTLISDATPTSNAFFVGSSTDGLTVFFAKADNQAPEDTDGLFDIYREVGGQSTLFTPNTTTHLSLGVTSEDGSRVFFESPDQLDAVNDTDSLEDVYESSAGSLNVLVSGGGTGPPFDPQIERISPDGSRAYLQTQEKLTAEDNDGGAEDVYERAGGQTTLISTGGNGVFNARFNDVTDDGSRVFFTTAEPLDAGDTDTVEDVYERAGGTTTLMTPQAGGTQDSGFTDVSPDGRFFLTDADDQLSALDTDGNYDAYLGRFPAAPATPSGDGGGGGGGGGGSGEQTSQPVGPGFGGNTLVNFVVGRRGLRLPLSGVLSLRVRNRNEFPVDARLDLRSASAVETSARRRLRLGAKRASLPASRNRTIRIKLSRRNRTILRRRGRFNVRATLTLTDPRGQRRTVRKTFRLLAPRR
jgi:hypothetical protein